MTTPSSTPLTPVLSRGSSATHLAGAPRDDEVGRPGEDGRQDHPQQLVPVEEREAPQRRRLVRVRRDERERERAGSPAARPRRSWPMPGGDGCLARHPRANRSVSYRWSWGDLLIAVTALTQDLFRPYRPYAAFAHPLSLECGDPTPTAARAVKGWTRVGAVGPAHVANHPQRRADRPRCSGWWASGSCSRTSPSPICCSGCRSRCPTATPAASAPSCARRNAARRPARRHTSTTRSACSRAVSGPSRCAPRYSEGRIFRETEPDWDGDLPIRREAIPIRLDGPDRTVFAVLGKDANLASVRTPSQLELVYLQTAADLSAMVADGTFPNPDASDEEGSGPRVGDGLLRLEPDGTIIYASPNSLSAFSRLGISGPVVGEPLHDLTSHRRRRPVRRQRSGPGGRGCDRRRPAGQHRGRGRGSDRAVPRHPAASARRDAGRAAVDAGRHRVAPPGSADHEQGRDDPRDPSPGEEQPADRRGAAAPAGPPGRRARGARRAGGVDAPGELDRAGARDAVGLGRRGGRLRRGRRPAAGHARRRGRFGRTDHAAARRDFRRHPGRGRHGAGAGDHRVGAERA